jgi:hypothetical protein
VAGASGGKGTIAQFLPDGSAGWTTGIGASDEMDLVATGSDNTVYGIGTGGQIPNQPPGGGGFAVQYDTTGTLLQSIQESLITGQLGGNLQVDPAGNMTFLGNIVITKLGPTLGTVWNISGPYAIAVSPDGASVYDWTNNPVVSIEKRDATTGAVLWRRGFATQTATLNAVEQQTWTGQFEGDTPVMVAANDALYLSASYGDTYKNGSSPIPSVTPNYVARLDSTGQQVWFRQFEAYASATAIQPLRVSALVLAPQGKLLVVGSSTVGFFLNAADGTGP